MQVPDIIIAVDGYSSTGKSTFAKMVAREFGFLYLDSGAMYRGVALSSLEAGLIGAEGTLDEEGIKALLPTLELHFRQVDGATRLFRGSQCIEDRIRTLEIGSYASPVSALPFVRAWVDGRLHAFSAGGRVIMDGRDIGTTVFPDAQLKIFMTADPMERARRRHAELKEKGEEASLEEVLKSLQERDYRDSHRETSPLRQAPDAFVLDNTHINLHEELVWMLGLMQGRFNLMESSGLSC